MRFTNRPLQATGYALWLENRLWGRDFEQDFVAPEHGQGPWRIVTRQLWSTDDFQRLALGPFERVIYLGLNPCKRVES